MELRDVTDFAHIAYRHGLITFDVLCEGLLVLGKEDLADDVFHLEECFERIFEIPRTTTRALRIFARHQHNQPNHTWELSHDDLRSSKARSNNVDRESPPLPVDAGRYILGDEIGRGGSGRVLLAQDRDLGRTVALKIPRKQRSPDDSFNRFIREAQATGQLQHPNIVPLYDLGFLPDGSLFYSMKYVGQDNLRSVLHYLKYRDEEFVQSYTLTRLLSIFNQVCMAIDYAHAQGIIHRDLKPENILLGSHGEVILMDWGLARYFRDEHQDDPPERLKRDTPTGTVIGTPEYMAPEQAMGAGRFPAVDIYSLGVILYEILCLSPPFESSAPMQTLLKVVREKPIPPSFRAKELQRHVPTRLEEICMKAMAKDPKDRHNSARQLHDEIEHFLDNRRSVERLHRRAQKRASQGRESAGRYSRLRDAVEEAQDILLTAQSALEGWEPMERKASVQRAKIERDNLLDSCLQSFSEAEAHFLQALAFAQDATDIREALTQLYCQHFQFSERIGHHHQAKLYHRLALSHDNGRLSHLLNGKGFLTFRSDPDDARIDIFALRESHGLLSPDQHVATYQGPQETTPFPMGRYLARVDYPNAADTLIAFRVPRNTHITLDVPLVMQSALPPGFAYVPSGLSVFGGDPNALRPLPKHTQSLPSFLIAHYPVTFGEYLEFINDLCIHDPERALHHLPRTPGTGILCVQTAEGLYVPSERLLFGHNPVFADHDESALWVLPVCGVSFFDALAFAQWRSQRDGLPLRLPTQHEWERAARSADERAFPWGDRFDPTFCKMALSRPGPVFPEPVGSFVSDVSPCNVCDLAGGVHEWTSDLFLSEEHPETSEVEQARVCKGGSWESSQDDCRSASRKPVLPSTRSRSIGFRLAMDLYM